MHSIKSVLIGLILLLGTARASNIWSILNFPIKVQGTVTSGGVIYASSTTQLSSSAALAANKIVLGGGAGTAPFSSNITLTNPATTATITVADNKTLTVSNTVTFTATDGSTLAIGGGGTLGSNAYTSTAYAPLASPTFTTALNLSGTAAGYTSGSGMFIIKDAGNNNRQVYVGYDATNEYGYIQAAKQGVANEPLFLNPNGGSVNIGTPSIGTGSVLNVGGRAYFPSLTTSAGLQTGIVCVNSSGELINESVACVASTKKQKHDITDLDLGLSTVMALRTVKFHYNLTGNPVFDNDISRSMEQIGFIAEQAASVDPRLAGYAADGSPRTFRYENYTAVLTKAIQELKAEVDALKENR